jgi:hypothetical protein
MAGFLYYLPGHEGPLNLEHLRKAGLGYAFEHDGLSFGAVMNGGGPDGGAGALVCVADAISPSLMGVDTNHQTWMKVVGSDAYAGVFNKDLPRPEDCARGKMLNGHWVQCGDEKQWLAPIARALSESDEPGEAPAWYCPLPCARVLDSDAGWIRGDPIARYKPLWDLALHYLDVVTQAVKASDGEESIKFEFDAETDAAVVALSANYRIGTTETAMLGLLTDESVSSILGALIDFPVLESWIKKNKATLLANGSNTGGGPQD